MKRKTIRIKVIIHYSPTCFWHCQFYGQIAAAAKLHPTLCDPMDCSLLGSSVHGILQARPLEWVAISFSSAWKWKVKVKSLSHVRLFTTPWTAAYQAPLPMGFSRQEYWSGFAIAFSCIDGGVIQFYSRKLDTHSHLWTGKDERKEKPKNMIRIFLKVNRWEVEVRCRVLTAIT